MVHVALSGRPSNRTNGVFHQLVLKLFKLMLIMIIGLSAYKLVERTILMKRLDTVQVIKHIWFDIGRTIFINVEIVAGILYSSKAMKLMLMLIDGHGRPYCAN